MIMGSFFTGDSPLFMQYSELIPHLFRKEFGKITAVLCKSLGMAHMEAAEDIASETFVLALETWPYKGVPPNPQAWLYTVARNKALNYLNRERLFVKKISTAINSGIDDKRTSGNEDNGDIDITEQNIADSQLKMMFAICHPAIPGEAQVGLALRILCGFGLEEIANAFLSNTETIKKRLSRAREKLRNEDITLEFPSIHELPHRLENVLLTVYLLFNEGYYSESHDTTLREDLCTEAMQLCYFLLQNETTRTTEAHALMALMCFHASRFPARKDSNGQIVLYEDQDESIWNQELIARGAEYLHKASSGTNVSKYHLEASIAYWHTRKEDTAEKWEHILQLYNRLLVMDYSPIAALNRTYAMFKARGREEAIREAEKLKLENNLYYYLLLAELFQGIDFTKSRRSLENALQFARTEPERKLIKSRLAKGA